MIETLLNQHNIKHIKSTPYHPQANGQVEVSNRELENILIKVEATWAYNTTWKTTTGSIPYDLVYGKKALLSIEFY